LTAVKGRAEPRQCGARRRAWGCRSGNDRRDRPITYFLQWPVLLFMGMVVMLDRRNGER